MSLDVGALITCYCIVLWSLLLTILNILCWQLGHVVKSVVPVRLLLVLEESRGMLPTVIRRLLAIRVVAVRRLRVPLVLPQVWQTLLIAAVRPMN